MDEASGVQASLGTQSLENYHFQRDKHSHSLQLSELTLWFLSLNKWKQQKQMFVAEVFRTKMKNFDSFTGQWRIDGCFPHGARCCIAAFITKNCMVAAQLKRSAQFVQRNWHRSPHDLQTEFRGSRPPVLSQEISRDIVGQSCHCHSGTGWMLLLLLLAAMRPHGLLICNSWLFKIQQYTSVWNFAQ